MPVVPFNPMAAVPQAQTGPNLDAVAPQYVLMAAAKLHAQGQLFQPDQPDQPNPQQVSDGR